MYLSYQRSLSFRVELLSILPKTTLLDTLNTPGLEYPSSLAIWTQSLTLRLLLYQLNTTGVLSSLSILTNNGQQKKEIQAKHSISYLKFWLILTTTLYLAVLLKEIQRLCLRLVSISRALLVTQSNQFALILLTDIQTDLYKSVNR